MSQEGGERPRSLRRKVSLALVALVVLWGINFALLQRGTDPVTGLRGELADFDYDVDSAYVVESETWMTPFGYHGRVRFRFLDDSGADVEVQGRRTLALFGWTIHTLVSRGR